MPVRFLLCLLMLGCFASTAVAESQPTALDFHAEGSVGIDAVPQGIAWVTPADSIKPLLFGSADRKTFLGGAIRFAPFVADHDFEIAIAGFPLSPGNDIVLDRLSDNAHVRITSIVANLAAWTEVPIHLPAGWAGQRIQLRMDAMSPDPGQWVGISEPFVRAADGHVIPLLSHQAPLAAFGKWVQIGKMAFCDSFVFLLIGYGLIPLIRRGVAIPEHLVPLLSFAIFGLVAEVVFFAFLRSSTLGWLLVDAVYGLSAISLIGSIFLHRKQVMAALGGGDSLCVLRLIAIAVTIYLAMLYLPQPRINFSLLAERRATYFGLPWDNRLNETAARKMATGLDPRGSLTVEWHTSDRPPLETGVQLTCFPLASMLRMGNSEFLYAMPGILFQAGWICGAWTLLRCIGCDRKLSTQICLALIPSGFLYLNTIFIWPKLSAAGYSLGAFAILFSSERKTITFVVFAVVCAVLAMLSHGGAIFFLLPALGLAILPPRWPGFAPLLVAGVAAAVLYAPWSWYQKIYDPPGNRLLKMHLAGVPDIDSRPLGVAIREAYAHAGWRKVIANKLLNFNTLIESSSWSVFFNYDPGSIQNKTNDIFRHTFRALGLLNLGWLALADSPWKKKWRKSWGMPTAACALGLILWCLVMFGAEQSGVGGTTVIHQGAYATQLLMMMVCLGCLAFVSRLAFAIVAVANAAVFFADYLPNTDPAGLDSLGYIDYFSVMLLVMAIGTGLFLAFFQSPPRHGEDPRRCGGLFGDGV